MANPNKAKATKAETKVARYLTEHGLRSERRALAGSNDMGDLRTYLSDGTEITVEVKTGEQTQNYSRSQLDDWKSQTLQEGRNSGCKPILVVVRYRRKFSDAEVWLPNSRWGGVNGWTMAYIDDFVDAMWTMSGKRREE